jgi:dihydrofolate reductase
MRRLILKMSMSLDGFVAGPDGETDLLMPRTDPGAVAWVLETVQGAGLHALGSGSFRAMARFWPTAHQGPAADFAEAMNGIPKVVFSRRGLVAGDCVAGDTAAARSWAEAEVVTGDLAAGMARLKARPGRDILAQGGAGFARSLVAADLVDEYRLVVLPVVFGRGLPLFTEVAQPRRLERVSTTSFPGGAVAHVLRPAA